MPFRLVGWITAGVVALLLAAPAFAVSPVGPEVRVDKDPTGFYGIGSYFVARTGNGGFAVIWEEDTQDNGSLVYEALKFRVFKPNRKPVAPPGPLNLSGLQGPRAMSIVPIGTNKVFAAFSGQNSKSSKSQAYGQPISISNGAAAARKLLATTNDSIAARIAGIAGGKAIFAAFGFNNPANYSNIPGRFIASTGKPGAANLQLALNKDSQLVSLQPLGTGFLAHYAHTSLSQNIFETFGRVFKSNGSPLGQAKRLPKAPDLFRLTAPTALSNNRILVRRFEKKGAQFLLTGQVFDNKWKSLVAKKTLVQQKGQYPAATFAPLPDGGFLLWQRTGTGANAKHAILRFNAKLKKVGTTYAFKAIEGDVGRAAALDSGHSILVYRKKVSGRERLVAQLVNN